MSYWDTVSAIFRTILCMSLAGSIVALLLFIIKPLIRKTMSKSAQYYLWMIVIAAYLLPLSVFVTLPVATPLTPVQQIIEANVKSDEQWQEQVAQELYGVPYAQLDVIEQVDITYRELKTRKMGDYGQLSLNILLFGTAFFVKELVLYFNYISKLRRSRIPARKNELALLPEKSPRLYRNPLAATPMLVGIFRPVIYLPDREYQEAQLEYILRHELIHWRRRDLAVKWLATLAANVHYFNPAAWLVRREINKACELACDEAVIRELDAEGRQSYGDTLIDMAADMKIPAIVVSTTMCEEKKKLKERLIAIMSYKKKSKIAVLITAVLAVTITGSAFAFGAGFSGNNSELIEFEVIYTDISKYSNRTQFRNGDILYSVYIVDNEVQSPGNWRGAKEIGYAVDDFGRYRIFEREGYSIDEFIVVQDYGFMNAAAIYAAEKYGESQGVNYDISLADLHQAEEIPLIRVTIEDDGYGDTAMELIYEDDDYKYYLTSMRSDRIMITFEDGQRISLKKAITQNIISIEDLILNGLQVHKESK